MGKLCAKIILFLIAINLVERFCHEQTDGFSIQRIQIAEAMPSPPHSPEVDQILNQKFSYFGCGNQCYVFLSQDGKYVLKFFKYASTSVQPWMTKVPLLNRFKPFREHRLKKAAWKRTRDFTGYKVAFEDFKDETALLCVHFGGGSFPQVIIADKIGVEHHLDMNKTAFVLQKKGTPFWMRVRSLVEEGRQDQVKIALDTLMSFLSHRLQKGIFDDDPSFCKNFGFVDGEIVQLDPGHYFRHNGLQDPEFQKQEIARFAKYLKRWLKDEKIQYDL